mgnify:CR=1 FL=1
MDDGSIFMIVALIILIGLSAFFSAAETAYNSLNEIRLRSKAEDGDARAAHTLALVERYDSLLSTILIGNNIVNIGASSLATVLFTRLVGGVYGPTVSTVVMTLLVCEGLYAASDLADLLLASCSPEIRSNKTLCSLLDTAYKVLVIVLCVAALAQEVGFPIGSIVAGAGLVGLTISLAAQESASNLFSGIVILLDKPFSVGDWITVGDVEGEVIDINFRSTRIRSLDKTINVVTNSKICSSTVQNAALRTMRPYKFNLGVTYGTTRPKLEQLMKDLQTMLDASPCTNKGTNIVQLANFGDSSINILVSAYLLTNAYAEFLQMQNDLNLNIMDIMQADGVDFAFPSTSVYIEKN